MQHKKIAFIGAGNMTRSIISGLISSGYSHANIMACNRSSAALEKLQAEFSIHTSLDNNDAISFAEVVVLAVKPQMMQAMCAALDAHGQHTNTVFVSIAAGLTVARLHEMLGCNAPLVRVMPNTPSLIGKGMSGLYAENSVSAQHKQFVEDIMNSVGSSIWVEQESQINGVIAAAGSSPAYFFLFLQAMAEESVRQGFSEQTARKMVQQAMLGAAEMVCHNSTLDLATLRAQVTSKGGTTAMAVNSFIDGGINTLVSNAMQAAVTRAEEMEKTL